MSDTKAIMVIRAIALIVFISVLGTSCKLLFKPITGIGTPNKADKKKIMKKATKWGISSDASFKIDTAKYSQLIPELKQTNSKLLQSLFQPLQVRGYNAEGKMTLFLVNCNIGGFPNLEWNRTGTFDKFPPDGSSFIPVDTSFTLEQDLEHSLTLDNLSINSNTYDSSDLTLIVYWAIFMGRQSILLIDEIDGYIKKFPDKEISLIYVNTDNLYVGARKITSH